jgi:methylphosphotriester-DNA--protein-cysteine methyltransferase
VTPTLEVKSVSDKPLRIELLDEDEPDPRTAHTAEKQLDCISFNAGAEERFCNLICALLDTGALTVREAIIEASFELDVSPETSKRYLSKHSERGERHVRKSREGSGRAQRAAAERQGGAHGLAGYLALN